MSSKSDDFCMKRLLLCAIASGATLFLTACHDDGYYDHHYHGTAYHGHTTTRAYHHDSRYNDRGYYRHGTYYRTRGYYETRPSAEIRVY